MRLLKILKKDKFIDVIWNWLDTKTNIKIQSKQKYERLIKQYIKDGIGIIPINQLNSKNIEDFFEVLQSKKVASSIQRNILYIIKAAINTSKNISMDLSKIRIKKEIKPIYVFSKEDQAKIESILKTNINIRKASLLLCLYTGLRIGELCGLKWEDINFDKKVLCVKRTIERIKNNSNNIKNKTLLIESTPKSETSNREIPIPDFIIEILKQFKENDNSFILSKSKKLYDPRVFELFYARLLKNNNIYYANFHTIRHTFATRSIESKMDIKTLSEILGHSNIDITLNLYVHPSYELKKSSIENLVDFMAI